MRTTWVLLTGFVFLGSACNEENEPPIGTGGQAATGGAGASGGTGGTGPSTGGASMTTGGAPGTGGSGGAGSAGESGAAGVSGMAGSSGATGSIELPEPLRVEVPCGTVADGSNVCQRAEGVGATVIDSVSLPETGAALTVTLRVRGVVEPHHFVENGEITAAPRHLEGPLTSERTDYQLYAVEVSSPESVHYLNAFYQTEHATYVIDYSFDIAAAPGATVTLRGVDGNERLIANQGDKVVPDVPPAPDAFHGQFVQVDFVSATPE